jgi:hypothetical protein
MTECAEFSKYGLLYHSKELSGNEFASYEKHLAVCGTCRKELEETGMIVGRIKSASALAPSPECRDKIRRMINGGNFSLRRVFWASLSAAAVLLITLARFEPSANDYENENKSGLSQVISKESLKWKNGIDSEIFQLKYKIASFEKAALSAESTEWDAFLDKMEDNISELNEDIDSM